MDGPADAEIFEANHLGEIANIWSKLVWNLVKVGKTYCHLHTQLLNPSLEELLNSLANCERDFDSYLHHILHLDDLLARDARHHIQLGYPVFNYPRYIPTTVELCRASFPDIIDNLKADLMYFKDDFQNKDIFKVITRPASNKPHPESGNGTSIPNLLDASMGGPGSTTPRGNSPHELPQCHLQGPPQPHTQETPLFHHQELPLLVHLGAHPCQHHNQYHCLKDPHHLETSLNLSLSISLSLNLNLSLSLNHSPSLNLSLSISLSLNLNLSLASTTAPVSTSAPASAPASAHLSTQPQWGANLVNTSTKSHPKWEHGTKQGS